MKSVAAELGERDVEHFLPLYSSMRRWKDRRVQLELPLFPGYVSVRLALSDRLRVVKIPSVVRLVGFGGLPTALPDTETEIMRSALSQSARGAAPFPDRWPSRANYWRTICRTRRGAEAEKEQPARRGIARIDPAVGGGGCGCPRCRARGC